MFGGSVKSLPRKNELKNILKVPHQFGGAFLCHKKGEPFGSPFKFVWR
jgi:hypothetical protein